MCGFCRVPLLMSIWGGGVPGRKNEASHITETMLIAIGNLAMWTVQLASCNVQWAIRNYVFFFLVDFDRNTQLPKPRVEHAAVVQVGAWCSSPKSSQRFSQPNLACTTPFPNQGKSCLSMVVVRVLTNRCRLCRDCALYFQFSKKNKKQFHKKKTCYGGDQSPFYIFHGASLMAVPKRT